LAEAVKATRAGANVAEFSVSELAGAVKKTLEGTFGYVRLRGEISGYRGPHSSGHCYFSLKDEKAKIEAVIWRGVFGALRFKPEEGMEVIVTGRVSTFPGSSKYQLVIEQMEPAGAGALMALLEARKKQLTAEGLFAAEKKRKLPFLPRVVGIVTSPTGAVIRDMMHGFEERFPTRVLLWPVRVQGETCAAEVANAIRGFSALPVEGRIPRPDVIIVARGGGSLEDLWGFNEEIVVRAAAESRIPLISAVGHETDWTLIDLASDARAPTPTKAAEWAVPKYSELIDQIAKFSDRLRVGMRRELEHARSALRAAHRGLPKLQDLVAMPRQRFDNASQRLRLALAANTQAHAQAFARTAPRLQPRLVAVAIDKAEKRVDQLAQRATAALGRIAQSRRTRVERMAGRLSPQLLRRRIETLDRNLDRMVERAGRALGRAAQGRRTRTDRVAVRLVPQLLANRIGRLRQVVDGQSKLLGALSYQGVLQRGFALVRDADGRAVRSAAALSAGQRVGLEFADGSATADIVGTVAGAEPPRKRVAPDVTRVTPAAPTVDAPKALAQRTPAKRSGNPGDGQGSLF
jgi:exodeoxyribonuclease VII large subunit